MPTNRRKFLKNAALSGTISAAAGMSSRSACASVTESITAFPDIPRIDVHTHVGGNTDNMGLYHTMRDIMQAKYGEDLAFWINLGNRSFSYEDYDSVMAAARGRSLCTISDYTSHKGLSHDPDELVSYMDRGFVGYKIWCGPWYRVLEQDEAGYRYIDDPVHEPTFAAMEKHGILAASTHIADPNGPHGNRTPWCSDPVEFWDEIIAWRRVLERHPNMTVVAAHGSWLVCQNAQLDFLRNLFATFPLFHVDLAATFQYFSMVDRENLRDLMVEWSDRILFGTDISTVEDESDCESHADRYHRCFQILETDKTVDRGFFGGPEIEGLALPRDVLEKIYYRNAVRLYPRLKDSMRVLGYDV
ncbi:amidohydrolase family protein [Candidatus Latescibacterota bacterium]